MTYDMNPILETTRLLLGAKEIVMKSPLREDETPKIRHDRIDALDKQIYNLLDKLYAASMSINLEKTEGE